MAESSIQRRQVSLPGSPLSQLGSTSTTFLSPTLPGPRSELPISRSESQTETSTASPSSSTTSTASTMSVTLPGSILPTVTSAGSTLPTPVASFAWSNFPSTIDTCTSATLNWVYSGPQETLQLVLVPNVSSHTNGVISRKRTDTSTTLATDIDSTASLWTWPTVNVTAGQYVVEALGTDVTLVSPTFVIVSGADTSCLAPVVKIRPIIATSSTTSTTPSPESSVTPVPTTSVRGAANVGVVAGGTVAGVAVLIVALVGYRVWGRRRSQRLTGSHHISTEATHRARDLPSLYIPSETGQAPPLTEKGTGEIHPLDNVATDSPLVPNRRPPSSLLSSPHTPVPPYTSHAQSRERVASRSLMDVSIAGSRSSAALSDATSTAGLMQTISSYSPPSYATGPSPPLSYATDAAYGPKTPRSTHLSYASSS